MATLNKQTPIPKPRRKPNCLVGPPGKQRKVRIVIVADLRRPKPAPRPRRLTPPPSPPRSRATSPARSPSPPPLAKPKQTRAHRNFSTEPAKSGRSHCARCKATIDKGHPRIGVETFHRFRRQLWYHCSGDCLGALVMLIEPERLAGYSELSDEHRAMVNKAIAKPELPIVKELGALVGDISLPQMALALSGRYQKFRSFSFGLPDAQMYSINWNWRCFLATILVCNTKETAMLNVADWLFREYSTPDALLALESDRDTQREIKLRMDKSKLRHAGRKITSIIKATKQMQEEWGGEVPNDRETLRTVPGVGSHVSSVTLAWVHEAPEFGVDVHVKRILERMGYTEERDKEEMIEAKVKLQVEEKQLGRFSRAFVDHGQTVCGFTPDCVNCYLNKCCPTGRKNLEKLMDW
jgi:endonuclease-3